MKGSTLGIIAGAFALIAGIVALAFPLPAGLAVTVFVGWTFVVSGALGLWAGFSDRALANRGWVFFTGLLSLILGIWILANPLPGLVSLTIMAGILFLASGIGRFTMVGGLRGTGAYWPVIIAAIASVLLGLYALFAPFFAAPVLLGTLLAIELISIGVTLIAMGIFLKRNSGL